MTGFHGTTSLSDSRHGYMPLFAASRGATPSPHRASHVATGVLLHVPFPLPRWTATGACVGCFSVARRPSLLCREVGVHHNTFGACSGFTRITARGFAREPFAPFPPEASPPRITPLRGSVATELNRQLPQRNFHPLDTSAFRGALQRFPSASGKVRRDALE